MLYDKFYLCRRGNGGNLFSKLHKSLSAKSGVCGMKRKKMNKKYEHMSPWLRQPNHLKCILLNIFLFLFLVIAMLGAFGVIFLYSHSLVGKLLGVLIGCVYSGLTVWVLISFTKLICTDRLNLYWSFFHEGEIAEVFAFSFYELHLYLGVFFYYTVLSGIEAGSEADIFMKLTVIVMMLGLLAAIAITIYEFGRCFKIGTRIGMTAHNLYFIPLMFGSNFGIWSIIIMVVIFG